MNQKVETHYINGDTFKHRGKLRNMGCRWDADKRMWCTLDPYVASMARVLVDDRLNALRRKVNKKKNRLKKLSGCSPDSSRYTTIGKDYLPNQHSCDVPPWEECECLENEQTEMTRTTSDETDWLQHMKAIMETR